MRVDRNGVHRSDKKFTARVLILSPREILVPPSYTGRGLWTKDMKKYVECIVKSFEGMYKKKEKLREILHDNRKRQ